MGKDQAQNRLARWERKLASLREGSDAWNAHIKLKPPAPAPMPADANDAAAPATKQAATKPAAKHAAKATAGKAATSARGRRAAAWGGKWTRAVNRHRAPR